MCLTKPFQVKEINKNKAQVSDGKNLRPVNIGVVSGLRAGDWVLVNADLAIKKINKQDAKEIIQLLDFYPKIDTVKLPPDFKKKLAKASKSGLTKKEIEYFLKLKDQKLLEALYSEANTIRKTYIKDFICIHGIIEFSNYCANNCFYCGIRKDNKKIKRYRMLPAEIIKIAKKAVNNLGYKMLVLQSGDDYWYTDKKLLEIIKGIKKSCRVFLYLSIGDRSYQTYRKLKQAGANGVLYRFETSNPKLYKKFHPDQTLTDRLNHLKFMKELDYIIASGPLIGLPGQTISDLANDILMMKKLKVFMPSMGPFISTANTPLADEKNGDFEMTLKIIAVLRLLMKTSRIPVTTALETIGPKNTRELAFKAGANSIMFNLTPKKYRQNYQIYQNKFYDVEKKIEKWALFKGKVSYQMLEKELRVKI